MILNFLQVNKGFHEYQVTFVDHADVDWCNEINDYERLIHCPWY